MNGNTHAVDDRLSFWGIFGPGRYTLAFAIAAGVAALLAGVIAWQASMPIWGGTLIVAGVLAIPLALKWQDDLQRYGAAAVALSILLVLQAFHTLEHIVQVIQFYVLDRPGAQLQKLQPGCGIDLTARHDGKRVLQHTVGARVAIVNRIAEQMTCFVEEAVVYAPGIDADAGERRAVLAGVAGETMLQLTPQGQDIPIHPIEHSRGTVGKAMQLLYVKALAIPAPQEDAPV